MEALHLSVYVLLPVSDLHLFFEFAECNVVLMPEIFLSWLSSIFTATFPEFCCFLFLHDSLEFLIQKFEEKILC